MRHSETQTTEQTSPSQVDFGHPTIACIEAYAPITEAIQMMTGHQVGDLVVVERNGAASRPIGMITDRDIALKGFNNHTEETVKVSDIMTGSVATASVHEDPFSMIQTMRDCGVTRLPVLDGDGSLVGVVTAKKLIQLLVQGLNDLANISKQQQVNERRATH